MIGPSPVMQDIFRLIEHTAASDKPVLIQGESGTGKDLAALTLHRLSPLANKRLVTVNCAAIPASQLDSELFGHAELGHAEGAFPGAIAAKRGLFEIAEGGTLFINEIGDASPPIQSKLLKAIEEGSIQRTGSNVEQRVNVRVITATHRDLEREVNNQKFCQDLYYCINVMGIVLPPLRQRTGDIPVLAKAFAGDNWPIEEAVLEQINQHRWPGNVRQLQNAIERAKVLSDHHRIELKNMPHEILDTPAYSEDRSLSTGDVDLETLNKFHVRQTYHRCDQNKAQTARALGITRRSLYRLLEKFDIE